jgi:G-patch domain
VLLTILLLLRGFQLLKKMGFQEGKGVGSAGQGRVDPLQVSLRKNRSGK